MIGSLLTGDAQKAHAAEMQQVQDLEQHGTPEQKREWAKDAILRAIKAGDFVIRFARARVGY